MKIWVDSNDPTISNQDSVDKSERYCNDCEEHTDQVLESELLEKIKEW